MKIYQAKLLSLVLLLAAFCGSAAAFEIDDEALKNKKIFGIQFPDETSFYAQASLVVSVSKNEYIVQQAIFVTEVTVSLSGSPNNVRIYHATPMNSEQFEKILQRKFSKTAIDRMSQAFSSAKAVRDSDFAKTPVRDLRKLLTATAVHKDYPTTTHAKNLEFAVSDLDELLAFYERISTDFAGLQPRQKADEQGASANVSGTGASKASSGDNVNPNMNGRLYIMEDSSEDK